MPKIKEIAPEFNFRNLISLSADNILIVHEMFHGLRTYKTCKGKYMRIKIDMNKAYDRVEWPFIENILRKLVSQKMDHMDDVVY